jgi:hypothetical protein
MSGSMTIIKESYNPFIFASLREFYSGYAPGHDITRPITPAGKLALQLSFLLHPTQGTSINTIGLCIRSPNWLTVPV